MPTCIKSNVLLAPYTTFGIGGAAEYFADVTTHEDLVEVIQWAKAESVPIQILGGGSNVLIDDEGVSGLVLRVRFLECEYTDIDEKFVLVHAGAGMLLDTLVGETVAKGLWGIENLSGIPGTVGAMPIQNVGAYGVEAKDVISSVTVFDRETGNIHELDTSACAFGYRHSIFKTAAGSSYVVLRVTLMLSRIAQPHIGYKDLAEYFKSTLEVSLANVRDAVLSIRSGKFPDWHVFGTAGSFFKNPSIPQEQYDQLAVRYPGIPGFPNDDGSVKVPLGWVLDRVLGYRGLREGNVGLYEKQALVLINYGGASYTEVLAFAGTVSKKVFEKIEIAIEYEVVCLTNKK